VLVAKSLVVTGVVVSGVGVVVTVVVVSVVLDAMLAFVLLRCELQPKSTSAAMTGANAARKICFFMVASCAESVSGTVPVSNNVS
jgi:hypothetical protein